MFAVIIENVAPDEPSKSGTKFNVDYFAHLNPAKEFAVYRANKYTTITIFEEIGFVHNGEVNMSSKFERNNQPIRVDNNAEDSH